MSTNHAAFEEFFRDYAATSRDPSAERIAAFYAPSFIAGGPRGSAVFNNDAAFLDWLRNLHEFNERSGLVSVEVVSVAAPVRLSPRHALVSVEWGTRFRKTGDQLITFRIGYLMEGSGDAWKILAYISEEDQSEVMREFDLV
ncbi:MAG TPA: hypothetical protein VK789_17400 [Bryobacteraceae bacterium]|jgi:hypothetical protein|nr:hypothetical protein [Bryobacteraceae bacterium]